MQRLGVLLQPIVRSLFGAGTTSSTTLHPAEACEVEGHDGNVGTDSVGSPIPWGKTRARQCRPNFLSGSRLHFLTHYSALSLVCKVK